MGNFCSRIVNAVTVEQKSQNIHEYNVNLKITLELCKQFYRDDSADGEQIHHIFNLSVQIVVTSGICERNRLQDLSIV